MLEILLYRTFFVLSLTTALLVNPLIGNTQHTGPLTSFSKIVTIEVGLNEQGSILVAGSHAGIKQYTVKGKAGLIEKDGTIIVHSKDQSSQIIYIDAETKVTRNGQPAGLSDLKPGDEVQAVVGGNRKASEFAATGP